MADTTSQPGKSDFTDSYREAYKLSKEVQKAEDARKTKSREAEAEKEVSGFFDETRELTEEDREGMKKLISSQQGAGEAFALKMNTEFGLRPGELKDVIKDTLEAVSGIPFVTMGREEAVDKIITKIAKELGDEPRYYYHPNEFKTLIGLLTSDELGVGLSKDPKRAQPTDEEINAGAKEFIKELYERIFEES